MITIEVCMDAYHLAFGSAEVGKFIIYVLTISGMVSLTLSLKSGRTWKVSMSKN